MAAVRRTGRSFNDLKARAFERRSDGKPSKGGGGAQRFEGCGFGAAVAGRLSAMPGLDACPGTAPCSLARSARIGAGESIF